MNHLVINFSFKLKLCFKKAVNCDKVSKKVKN